MPMKLLLPDGSRRRAVCRLLAGIVRPPAFPWHSGEPLEPFFIVGPGRCGTTLLRRLLQSGSAVHVPPENWAVATWVRLFGDFRSTLSWRDMTGLLLGAQLQANQGWFDSCPVELYRELSRLPETKQTLADFIDTLYRFHGRSLGADSVRWGDKTPLNVSNMQNLRRIFPRARFVFMLRDPADVVYSCSKLEQYAGDIRAPAVRWRDALHAANRMRHQHPTSICTVRYEDLVRDPQPTMQRVADFLGIDYSFDRPVAEDVPSGLSDIAEVPHLRAALGNVSTASIGKGRAQLTDDDCRLLHKLVGRATVTSGYQSFAAGTDR